MAVPGPAVLLMVEASDPETEHPSPWGALGLLVLAAALGCSSADLVLEDRAIEIALWLPLVAIAAFGCVLCAIAVFGKINWRVRISRLLAGLIALAPALSVAEALGVSPW